MDGMVKEQWLTPAQRAVRVPGQDRDQVHPAPGDRSQRVRHRRGAEGARRRRGSTRTPSRSARSIVTTIDNHAQDAAIKAEDDKLNNVVKGLKTNDPPVSALVAMQPTDGAIRAMYGGQGTSADGSCTVRLGGCLNLATQGLFQPGSSFKPYVLATGELQGTDGILTKWNGPAVLPDPPGKDVHNDDGQPCSSAR